jgi:hypothetical protein
MMGEWTMKNAAVAPEIADPYVALEQILKVIGRSWLSEEWRLEDVRLLAQEALDKRGRKTGSRRATIPPVQSSIRFETSVRPQTAKLDDHLRP